MLRYAKHTLENIDGIEIFPIIGILIFLGFFIALMIWVMKTDKTYIDHVGNLPLEDGAYVKSEKLES